MQSVAVDDRQFNDGGNTMKAETASVRYYYNCMLSLCIYAGVYIIAKN